MPSSVGREGGRQAGGYVGRQVGMKFMNKVEEPNFIYFNGRKFD